MCDRDHFSPIDRPISRRQFGVLGAAGAVAACAPMESGGQASAGLVETSVTFTADGGTMDGVFIHPGEGVHPAVILWPDIAGLRPAKLAMGRRLAEAGYAVIVANPYYRSVAGQQFADFADFRNGGWDRVGPWREVNTPDAVMATARSVVAWLDRQDAVDTSRGIGNQGYCMTGSWTILSAVAVPGRIKAAGSFHSGGLTRGDDNAPVNLLGDLAGDAGVHIAEGRDDHARNEGMTDRLRAAAQAATAEVAVELYDADHGWCVLDSPAYNQAEADRAWAALLALYSDKL